LWGGWVLAGARTPNPHSPSEERGRAVANTRLNALASGVASPIGIAQPAQAGIMPFMGTSPVPLMAARSRGTSAPGNSSYPAARSSLPHPERPLTIGVYSGGATLNVRAKGATMAEGALREVGILIFDGVEVLDFCGPFEVFSVARRLGEHGDEQKLFNVRTIAEARRTVRCTGGLLVEPHLAIDDGDADTHFDILVVPGGQGTRRERLNGPLLDWIAAQDRRTELTTSVCTGAFLLAERGILDGKAATTHWASVEWMREQYPQIAMRADTRYVDEGRVVTAAGISAGIDMSLHVVARLHGDEAARFTARRMEYEWVE